MIAPVPFAPAALGLPEWADRLGLVALILVGAGSPAVAGQLVHGPHDPARGHGARAPGAPAPDGDLRARHRHPLRDPGGRRHRGGRRPGGRRQHRGRRRRGARGRRHRVRLAAAPVRRDRRLLHPLRGPVRRGRRGAPGAQRLHRPGRLAGSADHGAAGARSRADDRAERPDQRGAALPRGPAPLPDRAAHRPTPTRSRPSWPRWAEASPGPAVRGRPAPGWCAGRGTGASHA